MSALVDIALANALSATALAIVVVTVSRFVRRPGIVHALWLVVLLDLLTPPVFELAILPDSLTPAAASTAIAQALAPEPAIVAAWSVPRAPLALPAPASGRSRATTALEWLALVWLCGTAGVLSLALLRAVRFERSLARAVAAPVELQARAASLARRLGLRRCPEVRLVSERVSPMLWFRPGRMEIVFPARLLPRLTLAQLDALLGHELAHVRRRDHWVRWLELAASALFFWHPVVWCARRALRRAEESCCDAWVQRILPTHTRAYADALLEALEFLGSRTCALPAAASGLGHLERLEERLTMILKHRTPPLATRAQRIFLAAAGLVFLLVFPAAADRLGPQLERSEAEESRISEEAIAIEVELRSLDLRRIELSNRLAELYRGHEVVRVRSELDRLRAEGGSDEQLAASARALDEARQALAIALASGSPEGVEHTARELAQIEEELANRALVLEHRALDSESQVRAEELAQAERARCLAEEGREDEVRQMERELVRRQETSAAELDELRRAIEELERKLESQRSDTAR